MVAVLRLLILTSGGDSREDTSGTPGSSADLTLLQRPPLPLGQDSSELIPLHNAVYTTEE